MAVHVTCQFKLPLPPSQVWNALKNISEVAACFPGATRIEPVNEHSCKGIVKVKLGPMQLEFAGQFTFTELDDAQRRAVANAEGQDQRGRGRAESTISLQIESDSEGGSLGTVSAATELSGTVAQFGRAKSVIQAVAETLIGEFAKNLECKLAPSLVAARSSEGTATFPSTVAGSTVEPAQVLAPVNGLAFASRVLTRWLRGLFCRP
jgi:carbon monoxide dehydrogenase subunit G